MLLGDRLKDMRKSHGYSQQQLANKLHLTQGAISQWENGLTEPAADQLLSLAEVYEISIDELLGRNTNQKEPSNEEALDHSLVDLLVTLSPVQIQRVRDFVSGLKASETI